MPASGMPSAAAECCAVACFWWRFVCPYENAVMQHSVCDSVAVPAAAMERDEYREAREFATPFIELRGVAVKWRTARCVLRERLEGIYICRGGDEVPHRSAHDRRQLMFVVRRQVQQGRCGGGQRRCKRVNSNARVAPLFTERTRAQQHHEHGMAVEREPKE